MLYKMLFSFDIIIAIRFSKHRNSKFSLRSWHPLRRIRTVLQNYIGMRHWSLSIMIYIIFRSYLLSIFASTKKTPKNDYNGSGRRKLCRDDNCSGIKTQRKKRTQGDPDRQVTTFSLYSIPDLDSIQKKRNERHLL